MPNLNLTHSGNMNITSASIGPGGTLDVQYEPNNTGYVTGWTTDPESGRRDYETGETLTIRFYPQFSGTVLTENFIVSGYDQAGVLRSDTSVLRQGFDSDVRHYLETASSGFLADLFRPIACTINSSAATENYIEVNVTVDSGVGVGGFVIFLNGARTYKRANYTFEGFIEQPPIPTGSTSLQIVVADTITNSGQASAIYEPAEAYANLVYSSSNPRMATIDPQTGEITVLIPGTVTFCVEDTFSGLQDCKQVDVFTEEVPLQHIYVNTECLVVDSGYPEVVLYPENATVDLHYWVEAYPDDASFDPVLETDVVSIDEYTGEMTVLQNGLSWVGVTDSISEQNIAALTCFVKSTPTPATATPITSLVINTNRIVDSGSTSVSYYPENADVSLRYYTRTPDDITIDEYTGDVTVLRTRSAQIEVYDEISHIYTCKDIVCIDSEHPVDTGTTINDLDLVVDDEIIENGVAVPVYSPDYAYVDLSFSSSDTDLATIDSNGFITVLDNGTVTFCVRDSVSGLESCKTVTVKKAVYIDWIEIVVADEIVISGIATANYSPSNGTVSLIYSSSDPNIASIDASTGEITAYENGVVTFCVRDLYTNKTDCKTVTVKSFGPHYYEYLTIEALSEGRLYISPNVFFSYKMNDGNWSGELRYAYIDIVEGDKVYLKSNVNPTGNTGMSSIISNLSTGRYNVYGNIMSWFYGDDFIGKTDMRKDFTGGAFENCVGLIDASMLVIPIFDLTNSVYKCRYMFRNCTNLVAGPTLWATTLSPYCYEAMFKGCSSLTTAPALPALAVPNGCYQEMFRGCTSLTVAPELPATSIGDACYMWMFAECSGLVSVPNILPATTLTPSCYYGMFQDCSFIVRAPELPAYTLTGDCYSYMFRRCTNLSYIKCLGISWVVGNCNDWVQYVSQTGTFVKHPRMNWMTGIDGIPSGWVVENENIPGVEPL